MFEDLVSTLKADNYTMADLCESFRKFPGRRSDTSLSKLAAFRVPHHVSLEMELLA